MSNTIQNYPWGSRHYLQDLMGRKDKGPLAELWMGLHPRGMSQVETPQGLNLSLGDYIAGNPGEFLGQKVFRNFGTLPYLFKLLAAGQALSIQAHPNQTQARKGFVREEAAGLPLDAFNRNYKDGNHKPEILCAITPFWAMKGFRRARDLEALFQPWCPAGVYEKLFPRGVREEEDFFRTFFLALMKLAPAKKEQTLSAALDWCRAGGDGFEKKSGFSQSSAFWVLKLNDKYPGDPGILAPLYLNTIRLESGEALYLPAGELHAYLEGFGAELMANSDNVLRGGLTGKYMDLEELENILTFRSSSNLPLKPQNLGPGTVRYATPSREFELLSLNPAEAPEGGALKVEDGGQPSILVVSRGSLNIEEEGVTLELKGGESCFLPSGGGLRFLKGAGRAFLARAPL